MDGPEYGRRLVMDEMLYDLLVREESFLVPDDLV